MNWVLRISLTCILFLFQSFFNGCQYRSGTKTSLDDLLGDQVLIRFEIDGAGSVEKGNLLLGKLESVAKDTLLISGIEREERLEYFIEKGLLVLATGSRDTCRIEVKRVRTIRKFIAYPSH